MDSSDDDIPSSPESSQPSDQTPICRNFLWGHCGKGAACKFRHVFDLEVMKNTLKFCHDYQNRNCSRRGCNYLHTTTEEQCLFFATGKIPRVLAERYAKMTNSSNNVNELNASRPNQSISMPGPSTRMSGPGPSSTVSMPGPSTRMSGPGPSSTVSMPGPSNRMSMPGPSSTMSVPRHISIQQLPSPSTRSSAPITDSAMYSAPGPSRMQYSNRMSPPNYLPSITYCNAAMSEKHKKIIERIEVLKRKREFIERKISTIRQRSGHTTMMSLVVELFEIWKSETNESMKIKIFQIITYLEENDAPPAPSEYREVISYLRSQRSGLVRNSALDFVIRLFQNLEDEYANRILGVENSNYSNDFPRNGGLNLLNGHAASGIPEEEQPYPNHSSPPPRMPQIPHADSVNADLSYEINDNVSTNESPPTAFYGLPNADSWISTLQQTLLKYLIGNIASTSETEEERAEARKSEERSGSLPGVATTEPQPYPNSNMPPQISQHYLPEVPVARTSMEYQRSVVRAPTQPSVASASSHVYPQPPPLVYPRQPTKMYPQRPFERPPQRPLLEVPQWPFERPPQRPLLEVPQWPFERPPQRPLLEVPRWPFERPPQQPLLEVPRWPFERPPQRPLHEVPQWPFERPPQRPLLEVPRWPFERPPQRPLLEVPQWPFERPPQQLFHVPPPQPIELPLQQPPRVSITPPPYVVPQPQRPIQQPYHVPPEQPPQQPSHGPQSPNNSDS
ncbi:unnamed protein product [Leptosia nina]|uniref:C3H1-type domain-containing protein n=1 Tax=Leptosia nina TaxID=320188 RepID=A0AAV1K1B0_9NEOP